MKFRIIFTTLLIPIIGISQDYFPFQKSWATWIIGENWYQGGSFGYQYTMKEDTVINDTLFSKIFKTNIDSNFNYSNNDLIGYLYEDSTRKVFYKGFVPPLSTELNTFLLYDFSLKENDSIIYPFSVNFNGSTFTLKVSKIDSIEINGTYRKRFVFDQAACFFENWIEGIGSDVSLFGPITHCFEGGPGTACYFDSNLQYSFYGLSFISYCFSVSVEEEINRNPTFNISQDKYSIFVNPINSFTKFSVEIWTIEGKLLQAYKGKIGDQKFTIPTNSGMYILKLIDQNGKTETEKIIKN